MSGDRAQLVLVAAAVAVVALVPIVVAYVQLGYHGDVRASGEYASPGEDARRLLSRAVHDAASGIPPEYAWDERADAVETVRSRLRPRIESLEASRIESGTVFRVSYNETAASARAADCPGGPDRQFGDCEVRDGIVLQDRADRTHVLAVAFDVTITTDRGRTRLTIVSESL